MRKLKPDTEIRNLRREAKRLYAELADEQRRRIAADRREKQLTLELSEWKTRFDSLLSRCVEVHRPPEEKV